MSFNKALKLNLILTVTSLVVLGGLLFVSSTESFTKSEHVTWQTIIQPTS